MRYAYRAHMPNDFSGQLFVDIMRTHTDVLVGGRRSWRTSTSALMNSSPLDGDRCPAAVRWCRMDDASASSTSPTVPAIVPVGGLASR